MTEPVILASGQGEEFAMGPHVVRILAEQPGYALAEGEFAAGARGPPRHRHDWDEAFYVLSGKLAVTVGDGRTIAWPGDFVLAPAGVLHTFAADSPAEGSPDAEAVAEVHRSYGVEVG